MPFALFRRPASAPAPAPTSPLAPVPTTGKAGKQAAVLAICVPLVGGFEGLRQSAYPDPATRGEPWTVCYGETKGVRPGDRYSVSECKAMLAKSLGGYLDGIERCTVRPMPDGVEGAFGSFAYNVGVKRYCDSSVRKLWDAGERRGACNALLRYNRAAGVVFPGLTRRREAERALCLKGV